MDFMWILISVFYSLHRRDQKVFFQRGWLSKFYHTPGNIILMPIQEMDLDCTQMEPTGNHCHDMQAGNESREFIVPKFYPFPFAFLVPHR